MKKLPISLLLVVHNEEQYLERCLVSCADLVDEILVVHDGPCTDRSLEICRRYTNHVEVRAFVGIPEPHMAYMCAQATNDWLFQLCPDEFFSEELRAQLEALIQDERYQGYQILFPTLYKGNYYKVFHKIILIDKKFFYFVGAPSEYFHPLNRKVNIKTLAFGIEHKPFYDNITFASFRKKWIPWTKVTARYYAKEFREIPTYNCPRTDWDPRLRLRIDHPIFFGIIGSSVYQLAMGVKTFLSIRRVLFLKCTILMTLYQALTFFYLWQYQRQAKKEKALTQRAPV